MNIKSTIPKGASIVCRRPPTRNFQPLTGLSDGIHPIFDPYERKIHMRYIAILTVTPSLKQYRITMNDEFRWNAFIEIIPRDTDECTEEQLLEIILLTDKVEELRWSV